MADMPKKLMIVEHKKLLKKLMELCQHFQPSLCCPSLRTIGNLATGNQIVTLALLDVGALKVLDYCLSAPKISIRKEAVWTISNITAGTVLQIRQVLDSGILKKVLQKMLKDDIDIARECTWVFSNAFSGGTVEDAVRIINDYDTLKGFSRCLSSLNDARVLTVALKGIENIFKAYAALKDEEDYVEYNALLDRMEENEIPDCLENLRSPSDDKIYTLASNICLNYLEGEEEMLNYSEEEVFEENT